MACCGNPGGTMHDCPAPADEFLLAAAVVGDPPAPGWVLLAFCPRHKQVVLDHVRPSVPDFMVEDSIVAEIAALPAALRTVGIDAAIAGLDEHVFTNVFDNRAASA